MRVLEVTQRYPPAIGGVETHVYRLSQQLQMLGVEVTVLTSDLLSTRPMRRFKVEKSPVVSQDGVRIFRARGYEVLPLRQGLGVVSPGMISHVRGVDVVHAHGYGRFPTIVATVAKSLGVPAVVTTHSDAGRLSLRKKLFDALLPSLTIRRVDRVIAVTDHERTVLENLGVQPSSIVVIPNGVNLAEFPPGKRGGFGSPRKILFVGRVDFDQKGVDLLLVAFSKIVRNGKAAAELRLAGPDGGDLREALALADRLRVRDGVKYLGALPRGELLAEITGADVLVIPSRFEPFGIVALEAMAAGVPVVAARVGGVREVVKDGSNGLLFRSGDPESLAERLEELLVDQRLATALSDSASVSVRAYDWKHIAERTLGVFASASHEPRP